MSSKLKWSRLKWSKLPGRFVAKMLHGHSVIGLAASALLYVLCVSGTAMVFHDHFARWEQPGVPEYESVAPAAMDRAARKVLALTEEPPHHFYVGVPVDVMPRVAITAEEVAWYADASGELVTPIRKDFTEFVEKLHYYLTLPSVLGLTVVGILGLMMTALVFTGIFAHPSLFRDAFKFRLRSSKRVSEADLHNRFSVWAAPFHLVIAFTGAALGLATLAAIVVAPRFGGDMHSYFEPIFGPEPVVNETPAPLHDIGTALENFAAAEPDKHPWYVVVEEAATAGQEGVILAKHPRRLIYGENYSFNAQGELTGKLGLSDGPIGQQVVASFYTLHFGSFAGLFSRLVYGVLGIIACVVVASGINIWLLKRRQRGRPAPMLERAWRAVVWGTPFSMAVVLTVAAFADPALGLSVALFWVFLLGVTSLALSQPLQRIRPLYSGLTAVLLLLVVPGHYLANAGSFTSPAAWGVGGVLLLLAASLGAVSWRER